MNKRNIFKRTVGVFMAVLICLSLCSTAFATEIGEQTIQPYAVSGSTTVTGSNETFYVYSPGSSWFAHANFTVSNYAGDVWVSAWDPNGRLCTSTTGFVVIKGNATTSFSFMNAPAGNYKISFFTGAGNATVKCTLTDW